MQAKLAQERQIRRGGIILGLFAVEVRECSTGGAGVPPAEANSVGNACGILSSRKGSDRTFAVDTISVRLMSDKH